MKCPHHLGDTGSDLPVRDVAGFMDCPHCDDYINEYASLGPATITPEVAIEIRAVELSDLATSHATSTESQGWIDQLHDRDPRWTGAMHDQWLAGWLGREIMEHVAPGDS